MQPLDLQWLLFLKQKPVVFFGITTVAVTVSLSSMATTTDLEVITTLGLVITVVEALLLVLMELAAAVITVAEVVYATNALPDHLIRHDNLVSNGGVFIAN